MSAWDVLGGIICCLLLVAIIGIFAWSAGECLMQAVRDENYRRALQDQQIAERADKQHAAILAGRAYGLYGDFPPAITTVKKRLEL